MSVRYYCHANVDDETTKRGMQMTRSILFLLACVAMPQLSTAQESGHPAHARSAPTRCRMDPAGTAQVGLAQRTEHGMVEVEEVPKGPGLRAVMPKVISICCSIGSIVRDGLPVCLDVSMTPHGRRGLL